MSTIGFLRVLAAYAIAIVPGYFVGRICDRRSAWLTALPTAMLVLLLGVELADAIDLPIRLSTLLVWETAVGAVAAWASWRFCPPSPASNVEADGCGTRIRPIRLLLLVGLVLVGYFAVERALLFPMMGTDTPFRWDFLAIQMLKQQRLNFYPPTSPADFHVYFFPDGFSPLISANYWWIYAAAGRPLQSALGPLVAGQYILTLILVYRIASVVHGKSAGWAAAAILAGSPLFFNSVLIGQETGVIALATVASIAVLLEAPLDQAARPAVLAGVLAAVAGSAREYAPAFAVCGLFVIAWRRLGWRTAAVFLFSAAVPLIPWLIRSWIRTGNPFFPHSLGRLPTNPVYVALMKTYQTGFGLQSYTLRDVWSLGRDAFVLAGLPLGLGVPAVILFARRYPYLLAGSIVSLLIWLASVGYTSGGGSYSLRALTPFVAFLAIAAGILIAREMQASVGRIVGFGVLSVAVSYGAVWAAVYPAEPTWTHLNFRTLADRRAGHLIIAETDLEKALPSVLPRGTRVLAENAYAHAVLASRGDYDVVPIWSPEVSFLFDSTLSAYEQRRRLIAHHISAVFFYPDAGNTQFCVACSPFYRRDRQNWKVLGIYRNTFYICQLPLDPSAQPSR